MEAILPEQQSIAYMNHLYQEYVLAAVPDVASSAKLLEERNQFYHQFKLARTSFLSPQIFMAGFLAKEGMEETLLRWIQNISRLHPAFELSVQGYSINPPDTLSLHMDASSSYRQLTLALNMIDGFIQANDCPPIYISVNPQMVMAANLPPAVMKLAEEHYEHLPCKMNLRIEKILLIKRSGSHEAYQTVSSIRLSGSA